MSQNLFLPALQQITARTLPLNELMSVAQQLTQSGAPDLARQLYQIWIAMNAEHPLLFIAHFNCSTLLTQLGDSAGAEIALRSALAANPDFAPAHINLGSALERRGGAKEAIEQWKLGLERMSAVTGDAIEYKVTLLKQISRVMTDNQQHESAEAALIQCLDLNPEQRDVLEQFAAVRLAQCKWPILAGPAKLSAKTFLTRFHPLSACAYADDPWMHLAIANRYVEALAPIDAMSTHADRRNAPIETNRRLRIGYVSSDLRAHAVGYLMAQLFEAHNSANVEIFVYYCGIPADDGIAQRVRASVEHWTDIRALSDDDAARKIAEDGIDILIDVNGHTRDARLGVFARRPAPIQVNWLGYPGTMGSPFHHYIVADDVVIPREMERYYSERVLRLPCYQPNDRKRVVHHETPTRASAGLPDDAFVFCCFNAPHKITRYSFERWMRILQQTPNSVLWLLDYNPETNKRLQDMAEQHGVEGSRLVFARKLANAYHLARYPLADLFIDTSPYGAHTTASDALWMGVPVLTFAGKSFASRVCASLLSAAGVPDLVTADADAFVERAIALATTDRAALDQYRQRIIANRDTCALFDIERLARELEGLYATMRAEYLAGNLPRPDLRNLDSYLEVGVAFPHDAQDIAAIADYDGYYRTELARVHRHRTMHADSRLWTQEAIDAAEAPVPKPTIDRAA